MTTYGPSDANVRIATSTSGSVGAELPAGDIHYFFAEKITYDYESLSEVKNQAGGNNLEYNNGKRRRSIRITNVVIIKNAEADDTDAFSNFLNFHYTYGEKSQAPAVYAFFYNPSHSKYIKPGVNSSHQQTQYFKCKFKQQTSEMTQNYVIPQIVLVERS